MKAKSAILVAMLCLCAVLAVALPAGGFAPAGFTGLQPAAPTPEAAPPTATATAAEPALSPDPASAPNPALDPDSASSIPTDDPHAYEPGHVLISPAPGETLAAAFDELVAIPLLNGATLTSTLPDDQAKIALPPGVPVEAALERIAAETTLRAQPNYRYHLQSAARDDALATTAWASLASLVAGTPLEDALADALAAQSAGTIAPNDPDFAKQWYLQSVNAPAAWAQLANRAAPAKPVTVAVMDADFLTAHADLAANVAKTYRATSVHTSLSDVNHGTHTAGTVGAVANNATGIAGVTYNLCRVYPMRVSRMTSTSSSGLIETSDILKAYAQVMRDAKANNIRVVSMSLGSGSKTAVTKATDTAFYNAVDKARRAGIVTVVAACNSDSKFTAPYNAFPSDFDNVVSVVNLGRASNGDGVARSSSSNYNKRAQKAKNIAAPGEDVYSTTAARTLFGYESRYQYLSGTSMAAPVVAGVLGLMFTAQPHLGANEAVSKLYSTARDIAKAPGTTSGWDRHTGFGEVDAAAAIAPGATYLSGNPVISGSSTLRVKIDGAMQDASSWKWSSSNPEIARPTPTGKVYGYRKGQAVITATNGTRTAKQVVDVASVSSSAPKTSVADLRISVAAQTYTGKKCRPVPVVRDRAMGMKLKRGTHFKVSYANNVNAGVGTVKITGIGAYTGTIVKRFKIKKAPIASANVKLNATAFAYDGTVQKPTVSIYDIGRNAANPLRPRLDYKLRNSGIRYGRGKLTITATASCPNFTGSTTKTYLVT